MIWHFLEVWVILLVVFAFGCLIGAFLNMVVAATPLATGQDALIDGMSGLVAGVRSRLGLGPSWRRRAARAATGYHGERLDHAVDHHEPMAPLESDRFFDPPPEPDMQPMAPVEPVEQGETEHGVVAAVSPPDEFEAEPRVGEAWHEDLGPHESELEPEPEPEPEPALPMMRPVGLPEPRNGVPDNLQRIRGIGKKNEELLNSFGIFHFGQIAAWTPSEVRWIAAHIAFPERIERDDWIGQAIVLAAGGATGYARTDDRYLDDEGADWA